MGKSKGPYQEEFSVGSIVRVAERPVLENFLRAWKLHNKSKPEQLDYAGKTGKIKSVGFYHGGEELYQIEGMPGIWHECCLEGITGNSDFV